MPESDEQFVERMEREKGPPSSADAERLRRIEREKRLSNFDEAAVSRALRNLPDKKERE
jgi:hypothetical protein